MPEVKRARNSLDWYVVSASKIRMLVFSASALFLLSIGGYWAYLHFQKKAFDEKVPEDHSARFIEISGQVKVKKANATDFTGADEKMPLEAGDTIQTMASSVARVQFVDGSSYTIKPDTTLVIKDNELMADKSTRVQVKVHVGTINLATNEQGPGSSNVVQTDVASARIGSNTEASVGTGDTGKEADIRVEKGDAEIRTQAGEMIQAKTNERLEIADSGKVVRRTALSGVPLLKYPENQQAIRTEAKDGVKFEWSAIHQASSYALEIATTANFANTIVKAREGLTVPSVIIDSLPSGAYYWRVRADKKSERGEYSDAHKFTIVGGGQKRELQVKALKKTSLGGGTFVIEGRTDVGTRVKVGDKQAYVDTNGNFRAIVTLAGSREVMIQIEDLDGNVGRQSLRF